MTRPLTPRLPKPWRPRPLVPLLTLVVLAVGIATSAGAGLRTASRDSAPVADTSHSIRIANFAFAPQVLAITSGDSITWTNQDEAPHTVTTTSGPQSISSPMLSKGQSFTYTFTVPGTYSYYCAVHPDMRAQVAVNPAPVAASTPSPAPKPSTTTPKPTHTATSSVAQSGAPAPPPQSATAHSDHGMPSTASSAMSSPPSAVPASSTSATDAPATDAAAAPSPTSTENRLDPTLVLAGLTAGTTVFCLFLVASRRNKEP